MKTSSGAGMLSSFYEFIRNLIKTQGPKLLKTAAKDVGNRLVHKGVDAIQSKVQSKISPEKQATFNRMFGPALSNENVKNAISQRFNKIIDGRGHRSRSRSRSQAQAISIQDLVRGSGLMVR